MRTVHPDLKKVVFSVSLPKWLVTKIKETGVPNTVLIETALLTMLKGWKAPVYVSADKEIIWQAFVCVNGENVHIGSFPTELERDLAIFTCNTDRRAKSVKKMIKKIKKNWPDFVTHHAFYSRNGVMVDLGIWHTEFEHDTAINNYKKQLVAQ